MKFKLKTAENRVFISVIFQTGIWWYNISYNKVKIHVLDGAN